MLDSSVAAAWFFSDDEQHDDANRVLRALEERPDAFAVPDLFYSELVHVLSRGSGRDAAFVGACVAAVLDLGIRALPLTQAAVRRAGDLACQNLAGYDATYVALAEDVGANWLTADERAAANASAVTTLRAWVRDVVCG